MEARHDDEFHKVPIEGTLRDCVKSRKLIIQCILDYIHKNYSSPIQLGDLAATVNMRASYISHLFSTELGVTFRNYLQELRLTKAKELLRNPSKRVCEVAYEVGYSTPNHFRYIFTRCFGIPPAAWRESCVDAGQKWDFVPSMEIHCDSCKFYNEHCTSCRTTLLNS